MLHIDWRQSQVDVDTFLRDYWQRKPLFIKGGLAQFSPQFDPDELAGLACEEDVESRIVTERSDPPWQLRRGPFNDDDFAALPETHWTLLVQSVDVYDENVAALLDAFRFIPQWRLDDVMVSFAVEGGSVGPHFDQYDVFLVQGMGRRHWRLGQDCDHHSPRLENTPLHILKDFEETHSFICEPGDVLYIPPGVAHYGIALENCMTFSVGFRAPSVAEVLDQFADAAGEQSHASQRFTDARQTNDSHCGAISTADIDTLRRMISEQLEDDASIARWFGRFMTECKHPLDDLEEPLLAREIPELLAEHDLFMAPGARLAYFNTPDGCQLFANGSVINISSAHKARVIAVADRADCALAELQNHLDDEACQIIAALVNVGALSVE